MSLLLLFRPSSAAGITGALAATEDGDVLVAAADHTPPDTPVFEPRGGGMDRPTVRPHLHTTGQLTINAELSAATRVSFDVLADDDDRFFL